MCFDHHQKTDRAVSYEEYKANRPEMPDDLKSQIQTVKDVVTALNMPQFIVPGIEADDLLGTIGVLMAEHHPDEEVIIVTGDKDLLQLVTDQVHVYIPARGKKQVDIEYDPSTVKDKQGVYPYQIPDWKGLMGDSSDNIPGIKGVGQKTATRLLQAVPNLTNVYQLLDMMSAQEDGSVNATELRSGLTKVAESLDVEIDVASLADQLSSSLLKKLINGRAEAMMSRELATIKTDVAVEFVLEECRLTGYNKAEVEELFEQLGFKSLFRLLPPDEFEVGVERALF